MSGRAATVRRLAAELLKYVAFSLHTPDAIEKRFVAIANRITGPKGS